MTLSASIVIPAYNSAKTIHSAIEACLEQNFPKDSFEIILVDDGSADNTRQTAEQYPSVQYHYQTNKGPASARNLGAKHAKGEIICFTDSDCVPEKDWLAKHINAYSSDKIAGIGGSYDNANPNNLLSSCIHEEIIQRHLKMPTEVNYLGGFNVSYRKSVFEEVNGFDESYTDASCEDNDIAYRIFQKGYELIFDKEITVSHYHLTGLTKYLRRQASHGYWRIKLYQNHSSLACGDVYVNMIDSLKPTLGLFVLLLMPIAFFKSALFAVVPLSLYTILQFVLPFTIVKRTRQTKYLYLAFVTFLRDYTRILGMIWGVCKFGIYKKRTQ